MPCFLWVISSVLVINFCAYTHVSATIVLEISQSHTGKNGTGNEGISYETKEAETIALETTGDFLPNPTLVSKISKELGIIRDKFPNMKNITHSGKFIPGHLLAHQLTGKQLKAIGTSEFGPLGYHTLPGRGLVLLEFKMSYNPYQLGPIIKSRFGVDNSPVLLPSLSSSISYESRSESKYTFKTGSGNCFVQEGCPDWNSWTYSVSENGTVSILLTLQ